FVNDKPPPEIYTLSLHDALPIWKNATPRLTPSAPPARSVTGAMTTIRAGKCSRRHRRNWRGRPGASGGRAGGALDDEPLEPSRQDRKSTRLNSSHLVISYAVFCL